MNITKSFGNVQKGFFLCNYQFSIASLESFQFRNAKIQNRLENEGLSKRLFN